MQDIKKKEIYCNQRGCFEWVDPRISLYCPNCEYQRRDLEDFETQRLLLESFSISEQNIKLQKLLCSEEKKENVDLVTKNTCSQTVDISLLAQDSSLIVQEMPIISIIPRRKGILRLEKLVKK
jgi:hypothetical protein